MSGDDRQSALRHGGFYHAREHFRQRGFPEPFSPIIARVCFSRSVKLSGFTASTVWR
jgi:hypothetical protein